MYSFAKVLPSLLEMLSTILLIDGCRILKIFGAFEFALLSHQIEKPVCYQLNQFTNFGEFSKKFCNLELPFLPSDP